MIVNFRRQLCNNPARDAQCLKSDHDRGRMQPMILRATEKTVRLLMAAGFWLFATLSLAAGPTGPTLQFDYGHGEPHDNPITRFMYFVPLISPAPVSVFTNAGNTQCARV